jgi:uncharacterized protein YceK
MKFPLYPKLLHDGHPATSRPLHKNVSRWLAACLLAALSLSGSGCVGTASRVIAMKGGDNYYKYRNSPFYTATRVDAEIVSYSVSTARGGIGRCNAVVVITFPVSLLSFPLDIVVDTLCLPYDAYKYDPDAKQDI